MNKAGQMVEAKLTTMIGRVLVVVPFLVAAGFATAAATIALVNTYGSLIACAALAGLFSMAGLIGLAVLNAKSPPVDGPPASVTEVEQAAEPLMTTGALLGLISTIGPSNIASLLRVAVRNLPLLAAAALVIVLALNRTGDVATAAAEQDPGPAVN
jgi:hypothetical protein